MKSMDELIDKIILGDCVEELKGIPDYSVDLVALEIEGSNPAPATKGY